MVGGYEINHYYRWFIIIFKRHNNPNVLLIRTIVWQNIGEIYCPGYSGIDPFSVNFAARTTIMYHCRQWHICERDNNNRTTPVRGPENNILIPFRNSAPGRFMFSARNINKLVFHMWTNKKKKSNDLVREYTNATINRRKRKTIRTIIVLV